MDTKSSGSALTNSSGANPDVAPAPERFVDDPYPHTLDEVREEMNYWIARRDSEGPQSNNYNGILKRLSRLLGIQTGLQRNQPGSEQAPQEFEEESEASSSSSPAAEISPFNTANAPIPADSWAGAQSSIVDSDSPFAPSDGSPAPADPWADGSVASSLAPVVSSSPNQAPADPFASPGPFSATRAARLLRTIRPPNRPIERRRLAL